MITRDIVLALSVFLASLVEGVEALTIVLAVGTTRGWRSTSYGVYAAHLTLAVITAVLGPALTVIPIGGLRLFVGGLLLIFGLQWLRKAILRASGHLTTRDEDAIYDRASGTARKAKDKTKEGFVDDWYSFTIAYKGVLLEGLEVAFIVITFGASQGSLLLAVAAALVAILFVVSVGMAVRHPLARVPENNLKFGVGVMLASFGTFWGAEGAGIKWPGSDTALLGIIPVYLCTALLLVAWLRMQKKAVPA